jgi:hypothetical protein
MQQMSTDHITTRAMDLRRRIRTGTLVLIVGLLFSGATAIPIPTEMALADRLLGPDMSAGGILPEFMAGWARQLRDGVRAAEEVAPFMFYGTDWLAFGHFVIAGAFLGALRDPIRNRWLYKFGMAACLAVPLWAAVFGALRGIPWWWRMIDASFGLIGFIPAYLCDRWVSEVEGVETERDQAGREGP